MHRTCTCTLHTPSMANTDSGHKIGRSVDHVSRAAVRWFDLRNLPAELHSHSQTPETVFSETIIKQTCMPSFSDVQANINSSKINELTQSITIYLSLCVNFYTIQ